MSCPSSLNHPLLQVQQLSVSYATPSGTLPAVRDVSFEIAAGETLALIGETGCGKSTIAFAILGLLGREARIDGGEILFEDRPVTRLSEAEWRDVRGSKLGFVFQDSRSALNPVLTVGQHMIEALRAHGSVRHDEAADTARRILTEVGVRDPAFLMGRYRSELSGGMCQRVGIALAICNGPQLLVADEPTSALDPTIQAQVLELLKDLKRRKALALLLVSHDLAMISEIADSVAVMYHGHLLEYGRRQEILSCAAHPYTRALIECLPSMKDRKERLATIPGAPPLPGSQISGCDFAPRCGSAGPACADSAPEFRQLSMTHRAACIKAGEGRMD